MSEEQINQPHDSGYKFLLSSKKAFLQLIRSFIKTGWAKQIEEANLVKVDKSFILQDFQNKEADLIYRARLKDKEVIFYVLMEMQSTVDFLIPYRLLLYMNEVWRDTVKNVPWQEARRKDFRLPVIVPIVLYNGRAKWTVPLNFKETLEQYELFEEHVLDFRYILVNVHAYRQEELLELSNLIGSVFFLDRGKDLEENLYNLKQLSSRIEQLDPEEFELFFAWAKNILMRGCTPDKEKEITGILDKARPGEVKEVITNLEKNLKKAFEDAEKHGIEKGMEKIARQMLDHGEDIEKIIKYTGLSREQLDKLK